MSTPFEEKIKSLLKISALDSNEIIITEKPLAKKGLESKCKTHGYAHDIDNKIIYINPNYLDTAKKKLYIEIIKEYVHEGNRLLEIETNNLLQSLGKYSKDNNFKAVLSFFEGVIPYEDWVALESSFYLKSTFLAEGGDIIDYMKSDIGRRYGVRGTNISNLCTAGYFEHFIMELWNTKESKEEFDRVYNAIVNNSIPALFIHKHTKTSHIPDLIGEKIHLCKRYHIPFVHIHAISKDNVDKINKCLESQKDFFKIFTKSIYENKSKDILIVELLLQ